MPKVQFTETVLRDANQSLIATRLPWDKIAPILPALDSAGFYSLECWGGATFDSCLRFLDEDPWERLRAIKKACPKTKLQMLLRGQNLLGYKHYPDDVVRAFIERSVGNGIDVIRIFDALNDLRNLEVSVNQTIKSGAVAQVAISYTTSPVHNLKNYLKLIREIEDMGAQSLCIKDMAGVMSPKEVFDLVKGIKESSKLKLHVHTHCTTGLGFMTYLKAAEAGADVIDTAISCFSGGTSQPATETLVYTFEQLGYETGVDFKALKPINDYFKPVRDGYLSDGLLSPVVMGTDSDALVYQIPGGMLSNLVSQLKQQNALNRLDEVLAETPEVRRDLGYPPLVTPMSQMVGVQAASNVLTGERYKNVSKEIKSYIKGEYGTPPAPIDGTLAARVLQGEEPYAGRYAATLPDGITQGGIDAGPLARSAEDVLSYILFPQIAEKFFAKREEKSENRVKYLIEEVR
ncbi:oxaloacetate decarboxylase [Clostridia bacterium]|nr:oxaloacetate decarboxylase [Clostridia bacterium]